MSIDDFIADFIDFRIAPVGIVVALSACMQAQAQILKDRTFRFAVDIVKFVRKLPNTFEARRIGGQLFDAGTSVAANYRSACKARSHADFVSKIGIVAANQSSGWSF